MIVDSLSGLRHLGLHEDNDPEVPGYQYGKSIFYTDKTVYSIDSDQNVNNKFEIDGIKYWLNEKDLANFKSLDTNAHTIGTNSLLSMCNLNPEKNKAVTTTRLVHNKNN